MAGNKQNGRKGVGEKGMDREKELWLESIGAKAFPEPVKYVYMFPGYSGAFNLSERYIDETPIRELKETYRRNEKHVASVLYGKDNRILPAKMLDVFKKPSGFKIFKCFRNFMRRKP